MRQKYAGSLLVFQEKFHHCIDAGAGLFEITFFLENHFEQGDGAEQIAFADGADRGDAQQGRSELFLATGNENAVFIAHFGNDVFRRNAFGGIKNRQNVRSRLFFGEQLDASPPQVCGP